LNPCTTCTMYISLTIFLFRSGIAFYFHLFSTVQVTVICTVTTYIILYQSKCLKSWN